MRSLKLVLISCILFLGFLGTAKADRIEIPNPQKLSCHMSSYGEASVIGAVILCYEGSEIYRSNRCGGTISQLELEKCRDLVERAKAAGSVIINTDHNDYNIGHKILEPGFFIFPGTQNYGQNCERPANDSTHRIEQLEKHVAELTARLNHGEERVEQLEELVEELRAQLNEGDEYIEELENVAEMTSSRLSRLEARNKAFKSYRR